MSVEPFGFGSHVFDGKLGHGKVGDFGFQPGKFGQKLVEAFLGGLVELAEILGRDLAVNVKAVGTIHLFPHLLDFGTMSLEKVFLFSEVLTGVLEMGGNLRGHGVPIGPLPR